MAMNFKEGRWNHEINVTDFVKTNITPYEGDASFLVGPTERTKAVWNKCLEALAEERANNGVRSLDPSTVSTLHHSLPDILIRITRLLSACKQMKYCAALSNRSEVLRL